VRIPYWALYYRKFALNHRRWFYKNNLFNPIFQIFL